MGIIPGDPEIAIKIYVEIVKLKMVKIVGVNTVVTKLEVNPPEKAHVKGGLTILEEGNTKSVK